VKANRLAQETSPHEWWLLVSNSCECAHLYIAPAGFLQERILMRSTSAVTEHKQDKTSAGSFLETIKSWLMVLLALVFVVLYGLALLGKLRPLADVSMVTRLEPLVFIVIGYYFGRLPGEENEQTLKDEIGRQTQRADASQQAKEAALQSREALDEKIKNARTALDNLTIERSSVAAAFHILSS
jgi:hypothetical protein